MANHLIEDFCMKKLFLANISTYHQYHCPIIGPEFVSWHFTIDSQLHHTLEIFPPSFFPLLLHTPFIFSQYWYPIWCMVHHSETQHIDTHTSIHTERDRHRERERQIDRQIDVSVSMVVYLSTGWEKKRHAYIDVVIDWYPNDRGEKEKMVAKVGREPVGDRGTSYYYHRQERKKQMDGTTAQHQQYICCYFSLFTNAITTLLLLLLLLPLSLPLPLPLLQPLLISSSLIPV